MSEILSQDEVDALLKAVDDGAVSEPAAPPGDAQGVRPLDLTNREHSLRGRLPGLEVVLGRFTRDLRQSMAALLGHVPTVTADNVELVKFETERDRFPHPPAFVLFRLAPLRGHGLLMLQPDTVAALLQVVCGGTGERLATVPTREYTAVELRLIGRLATKIVADLREAWRLVAPVDWTYLRTETNPLLAGVAEPQDLVMHIDVRVKLDGYGDGGLAICIPNGALEPIRPALAHAGAGEDAPGPVADAAWQDRLRARLADVPVEMAVELGTQRMALSRVMALAVGDLLSLDTGREGPVVVRVAGHRHFRGAPGVSNGQNAVRVTDRF